VWEKVKVEEVSLRYSRISAYGCLPGSLAPAVSKPESSLGILDIALCRRGRLYDVTGTRTAVLGIRRRRTCRVPLVVVASM
jgi:hypothetical protein